MVTGASSGIGRAITREVIAEGDTVVATVRNQEGRRELESEFGDRVEVELLDMTDAGAIATVSAHVMSRGPIDVLINNAGYAVIGGVEEMTETQIRHQLDTMLLGPILLTRLALPSMRENGGGRILQFSSVGGQTAGAGGSVYNAAKWGLEGFTEAISAEVAPFEIRVSLIEPGTIRTGFQRAMQFATEIPAYADGPVGDFRSFLRSLSDKPSDGDPAKLARVVVELSRLRDPPLRLALGADAYMAVDAAYQERIKSLHDQREVSSSIAYET
jgi:NAD(P)-dependent dehydrogenase (short-subunit alcohol dehydrogenase family)